MTLATLIFTLFLAYCAGFVVSSIVKGIFALFTFNRLHDTYHGN
jgi:hypothetical protein